jgi:5-methylcytosine-specific restriction endonuclease McrA
VCAHEKALAWGKANRDKRRVIERNYLASDVGREKRKNARLSRYASTSKMREAVHKWRSENPKRVLEYNRRREARRRGAEGWYDLDDIKRSRELQKDRCAYCRVKLCGGGHVDHIMPIILGGTNNPDNLQVTCGPCNMRKGGKPPQEFARQLGMLL